MTLAVSGSFHVFSPFVVGQRVASYYVELAGWAPTAS
jgi:hypothetical protein